MLRYFCAHLIGRTANTLIFFIYVKIFVCFYLLGSQIARHYSVENAKINGFHDLESGAQEGGGSLPHNFGGNFWGHFSGNCSGTDGAHNHMPAGVSPFGQQQAPGGGGGDDVFPAFRPPTRPTPPVSRDSQRASFPRLDTPDESKLQRKVCAVK
jgi:hypothetical protein